MFRHMVPGDDTDTPSLLSSWSGAPERFLFRQPLERGAEGSMHFYCEGANFAEIAFSYMPFVEHQYYVYRPVYWENYQYVRDAIAREKEIKSWLRVKKIQLIVSMSPAWKDLALELWPELEVEIRQIRKILEAEKRSKAGVQVKLCQQSGKKQNA